jgi:hypothetical protein
MPVPLRRLAGPAPELQPCGKRPGIWSPSPACEEGSTVLETIAIVLIILWLLGMVSGYTLGNFIYVLLVIAIVLFLVRLIGGRRVV